jgi:SAM-dependent methyltransferase
VPCLVCGNAELQPYFAIDYGQLKQKRSLDYSALGVTAETRLSVERCGRCGLVLVNPRIRRDLERDVYNRCKDAMYEAKPYLLEIGEGAHAREALRRRVPRAQILLALLSQVRGVEAPTFFDYGCGFGDAMSLARGLGLQAYGVDIDERRLDLCRRQGLRVARPDEFEARYPDVKADLLLMESTIEHLADPAASFEFLRARSRPGAVLFVNGLTPRIIEIERRRGQFVKAHFLEHINYFPVRTLDRFLAQHGFAPARYVRAGIAASFMDLVRFGASYALLRARGENPLGGSFMRFYRRQQG